MFKDLLKLGSCTRSVDDWKKTLALETSLSIAHSSVVGAVDIQMIVKESHQPPPAVTFVKILCPFSKQFRMNGYKGMK